MNKTIIGHIAAFLPVLNYWGTTFISTKVLLISFEPVEILFIRFMIGYFALWCVCPRRLKVRRRKQEWYFAAAGLCGVTLYYLFENIALTYTLASNVGVIISIAPFFTVIFSCLFLHEQEADITVLRRVFDCPCGYLSDEFRREKNLQLNPVEICWL